MRPAVGSLCRHKFVGELFDRAGLVTPTVPELTVEPYPDLGHAVDWEEAKQVASYIPDNAVDAMIAVGSGAEVVDRVKAIMELDVDAIWWRDEGTWEHPDTLMNAIVEEVMPLIRK